MQALRFGERYGYVGRNVAQLVDLPPAPRREGRSLAIEQSERLLSAARGERLEAAIVTGLMLGLRPGELLGLTRTDYSPRRATRHNGMVGIEGHVTHGLCNRSSLVALLNVGGPRSGSPETGHRWIEQHLFSRLSDGGADQDDDDGNHKPKGSHRPANGNPTD